MIDTVPVPLVGLILHTTSVFKSDFPEIWQQSETLEGRQEQ